MAINFSHFKPKKILFRVLLLVFAALASFAVLEAGLRFFESRPDSILACRESDPQLHHRLKPGTICTSKTSEWSVTYAVNSLGIREKEIVPKTSDEFRILVLGDSFTEGVGVEAEERFTSVLEKELAKNKNVSVINAGTSTYSPVLELEFLKKYFEMVAPDLVMVGLDMTDFKDEIGYYNFLNERNRDLGETNDQDDTATVKSEASGEQDYIAAVTQINQSQSDIQAYKKETKWQSNKALPLSVKAKMFLRQSRLYVAVTNAVKDTLNKPYLAQGAPPFIEGDVETDIFAIVKFNLPQDVYESLWKLPRKSLVQFADLSREKGFKLAFFVYPHAMQMDGESWGRGRLTRGFKRGNVYSSRPLNDLVSIGDELKVPSLNLSEDFKNASGKLYFDWDGHFTELGHKVAGKGLATFILENNLVD